MIMKKKVECKAIFMAVRLAKAHGLGDVLIESDSQGDKEVDKGDHLFF